MHFFKKRPERVPSNSRDEHRQAKPAGARARLRQFFLSPIPSLALGYRHWRTSGARIRRARVLCQCADGIRLRRVRGYEERSLRLYRRATITLGELVGDDSDGDGEKSWSRVAHRALERAQAPYRVFCVALARLLGTCAAAMIVLLLAGSLISPSLRARLFPRDLAQGRPWTASSADSGYAASGVGPSSDKPAFFHTTFFDHPWVEIDLGAEHVIRSILVENRADCCRDRALPLNFEVFNGGTWRLVTQRRAAFSTWNDSFDPVRASKVRLRHAGTNFFHLKRISIYGQ
jgi:hypothetical protein